MHTNTLPRWANLLRRNVWAVVRSSHFCLLCFGCFCLVLVCFLCRHCFPTKANKKPVIAGGECRRLQALFGSRSIWAVIRACDHKESVDAGHRIIAHPIIRNFHALSLSRCSLGPHKFGVKCETSHNHV